MNLKTWFRKNLTRRWFWIWVIVSFGAAISLVQINSYRADKHNLNGLYIGLTIVLGLLSLYIVVFKVAKYGGGSQE